MFIQNLIDHLKAKDHIYIQTHNFPDHDAVASAYGLQKLLSEFAIRTSIIFEGELQRDSLKKMINDFGIDIRNASEYELREDDWIVIVDGCKGNKNVTDLIGDEIAVIDHHNVISPEDVPLIDIRPGYGACSTIIYSYFRDCNVVINRDTATVLLIGINMDTALLTRGVSEDDIDAYANLYSAANVSQVNSLLRNYIQTKDLNFYRYAIDNLKIEQSVAFCYFPQGCNQNLLGILGDFILALEEVDFVILCADNEDKINISVRSERQDWNASKIIQDVLRGIGFGGGHADMAGGIIKEKSDFNSEGFLKSFMTHMPGLE
ncbi:MAG: recombinase RecJ [Spirochaetae bacterium HGW-Spirochaetae-1]|jgi:nanoRNase/pAp phosphatase (c-di-AMP/oligoRNAs hydrolase)|nr:MAG: recombinase RecJ [Spirochaetae bacterium HGW-Spirochaetae-1]